MIHLNLKFRKKNIKIRNYKKKDDVRQYGDKAWEQIGVIAQELQKVLPELVSESDDRLSVNYNGIIGVLIEAIKEQQKQIDELKGN